MFGGIDLGGTKIEACLFDANLEPLRSRRIATPATSYPALVDALVEQYNWMRTVAQTDFAYLGELPLGIGVPGLIERESGLSRTANLPASGMPLRADLARRLGFAVSVENDCKCFALSEATGGAGAGFATVFGLILGTGCGGGVCHQGRLVTGLNGLPGEVGHIGLPIRRKALIDLPFLLCGCGRMACFETVVSGPGMQALARHLTGTDISPEQIVARAASDDDAMRGVYDTWLDILCELLHTIQLTVDPDCIVLGGGLSRIDGIAGHLSDRFAMHRLEGAAGPTILAAKFGDSSGVRGAAMLCAMNGNDAC
ncbi:MAG: ROK family protein [Paracoccaceae bacterium]|nr:ROK family protein [Paracoccaceae bacterium]